MNTSSKINYLKNWLSKKSSCEKYNFCSVWSCMGLEKMRRVGYWIVIFFFRILRKWDLSYIWTQFWVYICFYKIKRNTTKERGNATLLTVVMSKAKSKGVLLIVSNSIEGTFWGGLKSNAYTNSFPYFRLLSYQDVTRIVLVQNSLVLGVAAYL